MGNPFRAVGRFVGRIIGGPIDFLSGKNCGTRCGATWDILCYIENFCIENLLKFFIVLLLLYVVLVVMYFLYKVKVFHVLFKSSFKMVWACFSNVFMFWANGCQLLANGCQLLCGMLHNVHERRQIYKRDIEMANMQADADTDTDTETDTESDMEASVSYHNEHYRKRRRAWSGDHRRNLMRKSLRAQNHRVHVGVDDSVHATKRKYIKHDDVRVVRSSSFAKKGPRNKKSKRQRRKT